MSSLKLAALLLLAALASTIGFAQTTSPPSGGEGRGTIKGRVSSQNRPLAGVLIRLWQQPLAEPPIDSSIAANGQTNEQGEYVLANVPPGNYFISATARGFVTGKENQVFANLRQVNAVGAGRVERVDFELVPEGVIQGVVTDAAGKPVARLPVNVFTEIEPPGSGPPQYARNLRTDDQGRYRVAGLPSGKYRIAAGYYPVATATVFGRPGYRRTFYGGVVEETDATSIDIASGTQVGDADINVGAPVKTFSVQAQIVDSLTGKGISDLNCALQVMLNGKSIGGAIPAARSNAEGVISIDNVPAGEYLIRVPGGSGTIPRGSIPLAPNLFGESRNFKVVDSDLTGIDIRVTRAATASGFVVIEGAARSDVLSRISEMRLTAIVINAPMIHASINPDGSFTFAGLKPGKLRFEFIALRRDVPLPLRFMRIEREGVRLEREFDIKAGEQLTNLRLILAYANSSVHGVVKLDGGQLPPGTRGVASLLKDGKVLEGVRGELSDKGEFLLQNLAAGDYTLAVSARDANARYWRTEQPVRIQDESDLEVTVTLKSSASSRANSNQPPQ